MLLDIYSRVGILEQVLTKGLSLCQQETTGFSPFLLLCADLKELWTKEVNIPEVKPSYENVTELHEHLEDSLKLAQEEQQKS